MSVQELLLGYNSVAGYLDELLAPNATTYDINGNSKVPLPLYAPNYVASTTSLLADSGNDVVYVRCSDTTIQQFRLSTGQFLKQIAGVSRGCRNALFTAGGQVVLYQNQFLDICKVTAFTPAAQVTTFVSATALGQPRTFRTMRWGPDGNLYVLVDYGGDEYPAHQAVLRIDGVSGNVVGTAISQQQSNTANGIVFALDFDIGLDNKIYVYQLKGTSPVVSRYDFNSGAYLDEFVPTADLPTGLQCVSVTPDGKLLYALSVDRIRVFDVTSGAKREDYATPISGATGITFATKHTTEKKAPSSMTILMIIQILFGVTNDGAGVLRVNGGPPQPWGPLVYQALAIWESMSSPDRDAAAAFAIRQIGQTMSPESKAGVEKAILSGLSKPIQSRMAVLTEGGR